jgi:hypothetical protein
MLMVSIKARTDFHDISKLAMYLYAPCSCPWPKPWPEARVVSATKNNSRLRQAGGEGGGSNGDGCALPA